MVYKKPLLEIASMANNTLGRIPTEAKVVLLGDSQVGKTSIITQYVSHVFGQDSIPTIGSYYTTKDINIDGYVLCLHLWDTAGQERYRSLIPMYSRGASAAVLVFDFNEPESFNGLDQWYTSLRENINGGCLIYLVGNKNDLEAKVSIDDAESWAKDKKIRFFSTTATRFESVEKLFVEVSKDIIQAIRQNYEKGENNQDPVKLNLNIEKKENVRVE